ncbi:uncharacterized protein ARMOST_02716 [Armillaria ostoyae]|uniref:Uncharacterized protein n=1 Tax=Armillaria ostoyae TaxID=47428 RepID=A0A284QSH3_ARMOS|nr:uncharacterized protein ARMOST_02716 [Armillaria ostoyae]
MKACFNMWDGVLRGARPYSILHKRRFPVVLVARPVLIQPRFQNRSRSLTLVWYGGTTRARIWTRRSLAWV